MNNKRINSKTKILCTLGPAVNTADMIEKMINAGMDGIRLNFSHGNYGFYDDLFNEINKAIERTNNPLAILVDLQGPKIRVGEIENNSVQLISGNNIKITIDDVVGNSSLISSSYKELIIDASVGDSILINDGLIRLKILGKEERSLDCLIEIGGVLSSRKGMNLPGMKLSTPSITNKDFKDLEYVLNKRVDYIALSFVRSANDILMLKSWLKDRNRIIPIIAKIEKKEAVDDFDNILNAADGIMIARGDLGVEMATQDVPVIQKEIINKCNKYGKLVITATQMLESMIENPLPTRAEASDVANAVWDGTDVVMLSGETSVGKYPVETIQVMNEILISAESHTYHSIVSNYNIPQSPEENIFDSINNAIVSISKQINTKVIATLTTGGRTAVSLSKYRPVAKIVALSNNYDTINKLCLVWGVFPFYLPEINKEHLVIDKAKEIIAKTGLLNSGDSIIFTAGTPYPDKSRTSWIKYEIMD